MDIREKKAGDVFVLEPVGRLDTKTSTEFEKKVTTSLAAGERLVVIDLVDIDYISSAGLRVMLMLAKKLSAQDGKLILSSMNDQVREVFDIAGFTSVFTIAASQQEAIAALGAVQTKAPSVSEMAAKLLGIGRSRGTSSQTPSPQADPSAVSARAAELLRESDDEK